MEPIPSYNLLQSIDPTKVKVPISERKLNTHPYTQTHS